MKRSLLIFTIGFFLNALWEYFHLSLYAQRPLSPDSLLLLVASLIDAVVVVCIVWFVAFLRLHPAGSPKNHLVEGAAGVLFATVNEEIALGLNLWAYAPAMPLIPFLGVGLSPVLQMALTVPATAWMAKRVSK